MKKVSPKVGDFVIITDDIGQIMNYGIDEDSADQIAGRRAEVVKVVQGEPFNIKVDIEGGWWLYDEKGYTMEPVQMLFQFGSDHA